MDLQGPQLAVRLVRNPDEDALVLVGRMTEGILAALILPGDLAPTVRIDLHGVSAVNSGGIREWCAFLRHVGPGRRIVLERCSPSFVMAANAVRDLVAGVRVSSVCRGFECPVNHYWWSEVVLVGLDPKAADRARVTCPRCGERARPEWSADEYFGFLAGPP